MLSRIKLVNFRQHRAAEFNLGEGFTVIRGANEAGKSTIFEAISYALFGVKAIRSPLSETVTWGQAEASLQVELDLVVDGVTYSIKRGKPGAELVYGGDGMVTGQNEVTNFVGRLLKVDATAAGRLQMANQKEIASALQAGTKETTALIEKLAEFDQLDKLIELMQEKLALGNGAQAQAQLDAATARVERAKSVPEPDMAALQSDVDTTTAIAATRASVLDTNQKVLDAAREELTKVQTSQQERASLAKRLARFETRYADAMNEMRQLKAKPAHAPDDADEQILKLMAAKEDVTKVVKAAEAYGRVKGLLGPLDITHLKGGLAAWQVAQAKAQAGVDAARAQLREGDVKYATLKAKLNSGNCTFCGQDFSDLPEVKAKNAETQAALSEIDAQLSVAQRSANEHAETIKTLLIIQEQGRPVVDAAQKYAEYLHVDDSTYPPVLTWTGPEAPLTCTLDADSYDNDIKRIKLQVREARDWAAAIQANEQLLDSFDPERQAIAERQRELGPETADGVDRQAAVNAATEQVNEARAELKANERALEAAKDAMKDAKRNWEWAQKEVGEAEAAVVVARDALVSLDFNNALLKKVRAARPIIADKLWNLVLKSVSGYFSEMRGVKSKVSKGPDGFLIDDHNVQSFSGSAIDVLGLAIRVALVRTFLPNSQFLTLDEPAAACNETRTDNMLGFLQGSGFKQILLVTHEDISESVADHIITIGE